MWIGKRRGRAPTATSALRVSRKLVSSEELIARLGGVRVRMDIDRYDLWSDRGDISVRDLWQTYARYPYMARLSSFDILISSDQRRHSQHELGPGDICLRRRRTTARNGWVSTPLSMWR